MKYTLSALVASVLLSGSAYAFSSSIMHLKPEMKFTCLPADDFENGTSLNYTFVWLEFIEDGDIKTMNVAHVVDGHTIYDRSKQYIQTNLSREYPNTQIASWIWEGILKSNKNKHMKGNFYHGTDGKYHYDEFIKINKNKKEIQVMAKICVETPNIGNEEEKDKQ
jgi:hypothetical protein